MNQAPELKKAASHPDVPRPSNNELVKLAMEVCHAIERCGASSELTNAVMLSSDLHTYLQKPEVDVVPGEQFGRAIGGPVAAALDSALEFATGMRQEPMGQRPKEPTGPIVTLGDIERSISSESYFTAGAAIEALGMPVMDEHAFLTFCVLILRNGTKIVGINYGPVSPENFDSAKGRVEARAHAIEQIWPLMGYALREKLAFGEYSVRTGPECSLSFPEDQKGGAA